MAVYDLQEQEQIEELKTWWTRYGSQVTTAVTIVALVVAGWQGWNWWQRKQAAEASAVYMKIEEAIGARDAKKTRELAGELIEKYSRTAYASMGALLSARAQVEFGDAKTAHTQLQWVADESKDPIVRDIARLRLAALLLDEKSYDDALKQLAVAPLESLAPRYAELKGDVLATQGKKSDATAAYVAAIAALDKARKQQGAEELHTRYREMLQAKLDSLGGAK